MQKQVTLATVCVSLIRDPSSSLLSSVLFHVSSKEAGLFVPSGTMGNLLAVLCHCTARGSEVILGDQSHIYYYEQGNVAQFGGVHSRALRTQFDGTLDLNEIKSAIRGDSDDHSPLTQLIVLEQTHNRMGGCVLTVEYIDAVAAIARENGLPLHIDGARLLNASTALGVAPARLVRDAASISLCLSKGLGAPIGSVLVGDATFIRAARRLRKALGGGMRQVGVLAAAGIIALNEVAPLLALDHAHAQSIARGLDGVAGLIVPPASTVETNLLFVKLDPTLLVGTATDLAADLRTRGVLVSVTDAHTVRFVLHHQITDEATARAIDIVKEVVQQRRR